MNAYRAALALITSLAGLLVAAPAHAAGDDFRWSVRPSDARGSGARSQFTYDMAPGQKLDDHVTVRNLSKKSLTFSIYAADAYTTVDGAFNLPAGDAPAKEAGKWIGLKPVRRTLKPGAQLVLPFVITVPRGVTPGDHAAGIIASVSVPATTADGQQVVVDRRVAARMYLRIAGTLDPRVQVEAVTARYDNPLAPGGRGPLTVTYAVHNTGNVRIGGTAEISVAGLFGAGLADPVRRELPELLPGARVELTDRVDGVLGAGKLTANVEVTPQADAAALPAVTGSTVLWRVPWTLVYVLLVAAVVIVAWRRRRRGSAVPPPASVPLGAVSA